MLYNFYKPEIHKGNLPVRVLVYDVLDWHENISPDIKDEFKGEFFNGHKQAIKYNTKRTSPPGARLRLAAICC